MSFLHGLNKVCFEFPSSPFFIFYSTVVTSTLISALDLSFGFSDRHILNGDEPYRFFLYAKEPEVVDHWSRGISNTSSSNQGYVLASTYTSAWRLRGISRRK